MIELKNISYYLPSFRLHNINLKINDGEYRVIIGESGSGKTLLLDLIAGFRKPTSGQILKNNHIINQIPIHKRHFAYVTASISLFPNMTVEKNLLFSSRVNCTEFDMIVEQFHIKPLLKKYPHQLSSGESQRVALARAIASKPNVLLLDEPLSSVDASDRYEIMLLLRQLHRQGHTIVHITHDFQEALVLSEKVAVMQQGSIVQAGNIADILNNPANTFVAKLAGIKNVYYAQRIENDFYLVDEKIKVIASAPNSANNVLMIVSSNDIVLSHMPLESSMQNRFSGTIVDILMQTQQTDVLIDIGIKIHATITTRSLYEMNLSIGKEIWVNFKASAINIIPMLD